MAKKKRPPKRRRPPTQEIDPETMSRDLERQAVQDFVEGKYAIGLAKLDDVVTDGIPNFTTWLLIGRGLIAVHEYAQAIDALERAIRRDPDSVEARFNLAGALYQLGDVDQSAYHFHKIADEQGSLNAWCNLATIIPGSPAATNQDVYDARREFARRLTEAEGSDATALPIRDSQDRPIRVGYVSAYFHRENYMKPVASLIRAHDRDRFEVHLFSDHATADRIEWFEAAEHDRVHHTTELSNEELVKMIRDAELDVLIDLNAYSIPLRLPIYTYRLAPVVIAWFNMYATSGLPGIDYIIGDKWVIPESEQEFYTEQVLRLPMSYLTFDVDYEAPAVVEPPCLNREGITFGSLISQYKLTATVWDTWAKILKRVPSASLLLANRSVKSACNRDYVLKQFDSRGIAGERIRFGQPADHVEFLKHYNQIDIALDAFPYNGGTTTTEAIWQGVPVLTTEGDRWASRTSRTLLVNGGLEEFVAKDEADYVELAVRLANDPAISKTLAELRHGMRDKLRQSPVCDSERLARSIESLLLEILAERQSE